MLRLRPDDNGIRRAVELLRSGRLVAFPTETVYGLGADASNPEAVRAIFAAKGRPADHPLIVHLPDVALLPEWVAQVPETARRLADAFWPGPMTLILERSERVSGVVTGGQDSVGVRVPNHPVARALLCAFEGAVAAPSANRFGHVSPTTADHVMDEFGDEVAAVVDGGACPVGLESTIVDLTDERPRLLRLGMIPEHSIVAVLGCKLDRPGDDQGPRASGRLATHYAPSVPLERVQAAQLRMRIDECVAAGEKIAVLAFSEPATPAGRVLWSALPSRPVHYARALYRELRAADAHAPDRILVEMPPDSSGWEAIHDRLRRAAGSL